MKTNQNKIITEKSVTNVNLCINQFLNYRSYIALNVLNCQQLSQIIDYNKRRFDNHRKERWIIATRYNAVLPG